MKITCEKLNDVTFDFVFSKFDSKCIYIKFKIQEEKVRFMSV